MTQQEETKMVYTLSDMYAALNAECNKPGGKSKLARRAGVSRQFIHSVQQAEKRPTDAILASIGLRRIERFEDIK